MELPIANITDVVMAAIDINKAEQTEVAVNILIDESANSQLQAYVRNGFSSAAANAKVFVSYFPSQKPDLTVSVDFAVIVAGDSDQVSQMYAQLAKNDVPAVVIAESVAGSDEIALKAQHAAVVAVEHGRASADEGLSQSKKTDEATTGPLAGISASDVIFVDNLGAGSQQSKATADAIGSWIVENTPDKRKLALSIAFPFVRRPLALQSIHLTAIQNAGIGAVVIIPGADMPVMTANQMKMVLQIAAAYGQPLDVGRIKELLGVLGGALLSRALARQLTKLVPVLGFAIKGVIGYAGTIAIGNIALEYFHGGGNAAGLAEVLSAAVSDAGKLGGNIVAQVKEGPKSKSPRQIAGKVALGMLDTVAPVAQSALSETGTYLGSYVSSKIRGKKGSKSSRAAKDKKKASKE